jgi:Ca2+-binding RTX toxin-like protein
VKTPAVALGQSILLLAAGLLVGGAVAATPAAAAAATCLGHPATIEAASGEVTGTAGDDVIVASGTVSKVDAGDGNDVICIQVQVEYTLVVAGNGDDVVSTEGATADFTNTDLGPGTDRFIGGPRSDTVSDFAAPSADAPDRVSTGGGVDSLNLGFIPAPHVVADLGTGNDQVVFSPEAGVAPGTVSVDFGPGRDHLVMQETVQSLRVNLRTGRAVFDDAHYRFDHLEDGSFLGRRAVVRGDEASNDLLVYGCNLTIYGGSGNDSTRLLGNSDNYNSFQCDARSKQYGGAGADELSGRSGRDVLIGGKGHDVAFGGRGHDTCVAEVARQCEVRQARASSSGRSPVVSARPRSWWG